MRKITPIFCIIVITACSSLFTLSPQAQETDAQKLLLDSIKYDKLDVSGVKGALDKGANPNWVSDTKRKFSVIGDLAMFGPWAKVEKAEEKGVEILQILFRAGAKLQPCDQDILFSPISKGWALFTEVLLKNGANPTREIEGRTPMEIAASDGQENIIELLEKHGARALKKRDAAQQALIGAAGEHDIPRMEKAIQNGAGVNERNRQGETALVKALHSTLFESEDYLTILYLLEKGANPQIKGDGGFKDFGETTALHLAILMSSICFSKEVKSKRFKDSQIYARLVIESLLRHGAIDLHDSGLYSRITCRNAINYTLVFGNLLNGH